MSSERGHVERGRGDPKAEVDDKDSVATNDMDGNFVGGDLVFHDFSVEGDVLMGVVITNRYPCEWKE